MNQSIAMARIRGDLFGGLTAAVIALPLALAFGVSSGLGAIAGLYGAILTGFFASVFGGTPAQISGPTGPMTVVMATVVASYTQVYPESGLALAFTVVMMAGLFQVLFGVMKLGKFITLVPYPVISGFMTGVGIIIIILQIGPMFGVEATSNIIPLLRELPEYLANPDWLAVTFTLGCFILLKVWPETVNRVIPGPIVVLLLGTLLAVKFVPADGLSRIGAIPGGLPSLHLPAFNLPLLTDMVYSAVLLAGLGSIDSLLTSMVADTMSGVSHDSDRELVGQGIGNMVAGLFGALPGAGATVRTVVNIRSGGNSRLSGIVHALILLLLVLCVGFLAEDIPHTVLAGLLIKVGVDIIDWRLLKRLHRMPLFTSFLTLLVTLITVFVDLIAAVMIGAFIANMVTIQRLTNVQLDGIRFLTGSEDSEIPVDDDEQILRKAKGRMLVFEVRGPVSFGVARRVGRELSGYSEHRILIIDLSRAVMIGITTSLVIEDMILREQKSGRQVYLAGINRQIDNNFRRLDIYKLVSEQHRFDSRHQALLYARLVLASETADLPDSTGVRVA